MQNNHHSHNNDTTSLRLVAWETTRRCNLKCVHCRALAQNDADPNELTTAQAKKLLDETALLGKAIVILTGGEPLLREDIFELAQYGTALGLRMVMAPNGTLLTEEIAAKLKDSGIMRVSISLDSVTGAKHDAFRGVEGAFARTLQGIDAAKRAGLPFQINSTITKHNFDEIENLHRLALELGAAAFHVFLLVPVGRGKDIADDGITADEYEASLNLVYDLQRQSPIEIKPTCAPQYYRILRQRAKAEGLTVDFATFGPAAMTRGCLGGTGFCFVSATGMVQPCGFLNLNCGDITQKPFHEIWQTSPQFQKLRDFEALTGKCGACEYKRVCGGCRARAYEESGDYMGSEPGCKGPMAL